MSKNAIILGLLTLVGLVIAPILGGLVAQGAFFKIGMFAGIALLISVCLTLRSNIWMVIPLCSALTGSIYVLPLPFKVSELAVVLAFGMFLLLYAMKGVPPLSAFNWYDGFMILNVLYLTTVYLRNPAGLLRFQTEIIGARPYTAVLIAILAYWVLQHVTLTPRQKYLIPVLASVGALGGAFLSIITAFLPGLGARLYPFYSGVTAPVEEVVADPGTEGTNRLIYLSKYGQALGPLLVAWRNPIQLLIFVNPIYSLLFYSALAAIAASGFRSYFAHIVALCAVSTYFRSGLSGLVRVGLAGFLTLGVLIGAQESGFDLPLSVQRTLSFLPGSWDPVAVEDAHNSSEWRFEMWRQALTTERYIRNKIFGDGFGYRMGDLAGFIHMGGMNKAGTDAIQEYFLVIGAYHSGPVSTIRTVGYFGLLLFNIWIIAMAWYAWRLIRESQGTPFFVWALFVASPVVIMPMFYWLIFGGYENDLPQAIMSLAALNILARSLNAWKTETSPAQPMSVPGSAIVASP